MKGLIFNIQKFSIHDGLGIRTLVFMKGCPLSCLWCSNPESQSFSPEIALAAKGCIRCGKCVGACPLAAIDPATLVIDKSLCNGCGACVRKCYANARKQVGRWYSVSELVAEIEKDRIFYRNSNGGVTVGGGEPLAQPEFVSAFLQECRRLSLHTAIETCGFGAWERIKTVFEPLNQIFFDLKHMSDIEHQRLTGVSNRSILENAVRVATLSKDLTFRFPLIPERNDSEENLLATGRFVRGLMASSDRIKIEVLPYHGLGTDKYDWIDKEYALKGLKTPTTTHKRHAEEILQSCGCQVISQP